MGRNLDTFPPPPQGGVPWGRGGAPSEKNFKVSGMSKIMSGMYPDDPEGYFIFS